MRISSTIIAQAIIDHFKNLPARSAPGAERRARLIQLRKEFLKLETRDRHPIKHGK